MGRVGIDSSGSSARGSQRSKFGRGIVARLGGELNRRSTEDDPGETRRCQFLAPGTRLLELARHWLAFSFELHERSSANYLHVRSTLPRSLGGLLQYEDALGR